MSVLYPFGANKSSVCYFGSHTWAGVPSWRPPSASGPAPRHQFCLPSARLLRLCCRRVCCVCSGASLTSAPSLIPLYAAIPYNASAQCMLVRIWPCPAPSALFALSTSVASVLPARLLRLLRCFPHKRSLTDPALRSHPLCFCPMHARPHLALPRVISFVCPQHVCCVCAAGASAASAPVLPSQALLH